MKNSMQKSTAYYVGYHATCPHCIYEVLRRNIKKEDVLRCPRCTKKFIVDKIINHV